MNPLELCGVRLKPNVAMSMGVISLICTSLLLSANIFNWPNSFKVIFFLPAFACGVVLVVRHAAIWEKCDPKLDNDYVQNELERRKNQILSFSRITERCLKCCQLIADQLALQSEKPLSIDELNNLAYIHAVNSRIVLNTKTTVSLLPHRECLNPDIFDKHYQLLGSSRPYYWSHDEVVIIDVNYIQHL